VGINFVPLSSIQLHEGFRGIPTRGARLNSQTQTFPDPVAACVEKSVIMRDELAQESGERVLGQVSAKPSLRSRRSGNPSARNAGSRRTDIRKITMSDYANNRQ